MNELDELAAAVRQRNTGKTEPIPYARAVPDEYPPCEICGYRGGVIVTTKVNWVTALVLFIFSVIVTFVSFVGGGVIFAVLVFYIIFNLGSVFRCGHCGAKKADA